MQFQSGAQLRAAIIETRTQLRQHFPRSVQELIELYAASDVGEVVLMRSLVCTVQNRHRHAKWYGARRPIGFTTRGHTRALGLTYMCTASPKHIRFGDLEAIRDGFPALKINTTPGDLWDFLCGVPSRVDGALAAADDPRRPEQVRAIFRAALVDFAARKECADRARARFGRR